MKQVLWITGLFPPISCGVGRQFKLAKYLPDYGWGPIVLAMEKTMFGHMDDSAMDEVKHLEVHRTRTWESNIIQNKLPMYLKFSPRWLMSPDPYWGWRKYALKEARRIISAVPIHAIFSTATPYTCHMVALQLKQETGLPWAADFRDLWTQSNYGDWPRRILERERRMEREVVEHADRLTFISPAHVEEFGGQYPEYKGKMECVTHGYDPVDFPSRARISDNVSVNDNVSDSATCNMTYVGTLYGERTKGALALLDALREYYREEPGSRLSVRFVGHCRAIEKVAEKLWPKVQFTGWLSRKLSLQAMTESDILLLIMGEGKVDEQATTGKLFDYLGAGKPIYAIAPQDGEVARIIRETGTGIVDSPCDHEHIIESLHSWADRGNHGNAFKPVGIEKYDVRRKAERMAEILEEICQ